MKHTPLLLNSSALGAGVNSVRLHFFFGESKNGFVISDHMDSSRPKKTEDPKTEDHLP